MNSSMTRYTLSVVLVTYNRQRFLSRCLKALERTLPQDTQLILWDNASSDNTPGFVKAWLQRLRDKAHFLGDAVRIVHHPENIGVDAYARAMALAEGRYLVALDDDVIQLPPGWCQRMMLALDRIPNLGFVSLDVVQDQKTQGGKPGPAAYKRVDYGDGLILDMGPAGGWCCMTTREIYDAVGGFPELGRAYYHHDGVFSKRLRAAGYLTGILAGVQAYHACGEYWNCKLGYKTEFRRKEAQRAIVEGDLARRDWRFKEALAAFQKALQLDPTISGLYERLADCYLMMEEYDLSRSNLEYAMSKDPQTDRVLYVRAMMALREGQSTTALEYLRLLLQRHPGDANFLALMQKARSFSISP